LGSFFAGIKAGTLGGILYAGGLALFNVALLYALKPEVLSAIYQSYSQYCTPLSGVAANASATSLEDCFSLVVSVDVPFVAFVGFLISLLYAGIFGRFYEAFPGKGPTLKGETAAAIVAFNLIFFGFSGFLFDAEAAAATGVFLLAWTLAYGYTLGRLYRRYTRLVTFESQDEESLRVIVDGRDYTGKSLTLAATSSHKVRAEGTDGSSFREWSTSGGITLEDPRSFETVMEVNGDGLLKAQASKK
jgi:hypothetical protein